MINTLYNIALCFLVSLHSIKAVGESMPADRDAVVWTCIRDLNSYAQDLETATKGGKHLEIVERENEARLEQIVTTLKTVVDLKKFISSQDKRLNIIRASGPGWNHPDSIQLRRALAVLKRHQKIVEQGAPGKP